QRGGARQREIRRMARAMRGGSDAGSTSRFPSWAPQSAVRRRVPTPGSSGSFLAGEAVSSATARRGPSVKIAIAVQTQQGASAGADAELPRDARGRLAAGADDAAVDAPEMVPGADRDPVVAAVVAAARAEHD